MLTNHDCSFFVSVWSSPISRDSQERLCSGMSGAAGDTPYVDRMEDAFGDDEYRSLLF